MGIYLSVVAYTNNYDCIQIKDAFTQNTNNINEYNIIVMANETRDTCVNFKIQIGNQLHVVGTKKLGGNIST